MRAVRFDHYGDVDVLALRDVADPTPGPGQVLVSVRAAGINPGEAKIRIGALEARWPATFPEGQGSDLAGVVAAVGAGVSAFAPGDEVFGFTNNRASHAELVVAAADEIVAKPAGVSWEVAGGLFIVGTSAYVLVDAVGLTADDVVVVSGAAGGVGSLTVLGLAGSANHGWLREHDIIPVAYAEEETPLPDRITATLDGRQVTALLDAYGPPYVQLGLDLGVAPERIASVADFGAAERGAKLVFHTSVATPAVLTALADAVAAGRLDVPIAASYPLDQVRNAFRELEHGHTRGKIVLVP
jgi:NADPH:quinone reductase-like Zn-dependent oxidoreductase